MHPKALLRLLSIIVGLLSAFLIGIAVFSAVEGESVEGDVGTSHPRRFRLYFFGGYVDHLP
jgi:hypothetical protein